MAFDLVVIGGGIIGLAVARQFLLERPGSQVVVLEKEDRLASHQTGRNSGVVHAGLYYRPGSEKAVLCRRGVGMLFEYCDDKGLAYRECGKVVVALDQDERQRLHVMKDRATGLGVPDLALVGPAGLRDLEPHAVGLEALHSPTTAIVDYQAIALAIADDITESGGQVRTGSEVVDIQDRTAGVAVATGDELLETSSLVICAGLQADRLARMAGGSDGPRIVGFRGEYLRLRDERDHLVSGLIYPVPDPRYPFLGVHFTRRVDGAVDVGPNAVLALAREGYRWGDIDLGDLAEVAGWPGTWHLARRHWRTGIHELLGSASRRITTRRARRYVPAVRLEDLVPAPAGVRAQALARDGSLVDDFVLEHHGRVLAVRNAPSPAATASLAIAERIVTTMTAG